MIGCSPISTCVKNLIFLSGRFPKQMRSNICHAVSQGPSRSCCFYSYQGKTKTNYTSLSISGISCPSISLEGCLGTGFSKLKGQSNSVTVRGLVPQNRCLEISLGCQTSCMKLLVSRQRMLPKIKYNRGSTSRPKGCASTSLAFGLFVCYASTEPVHAEASNEDEDEDENLPYVKFSHGKKVFTDYSVIGIPGDGRCMFRSVAHGACMRSGKPAPSESLQRELADELRARVADEFIQRREETEWFVEGDFDTYVSRMRKPYVWGGEPELFMASHVLRMPITVYMYDKDAGGLISIAEYGQEYGKRNPIRVLYHGYGHYDALQIPGNKGSRSKL